MSRATRIFRRSLFVVVGLVGLIFTAAFVMIFLGDPEFGPPPPMTPEAMAAFAARYEQIYPSETRRFPMRDGVSLAAHRFAANSDTTIVLVHGILGSSLEMNRPAGLLREATSSTVVALDLRGHGASGGAPGDISYIGQYEDDLADVVAKIRAERPHGRVILAGHSMGGGIILRYVTRSGAPPVDGYLLFAPYLGAQSPTTPQESRPGEEAFIRLHLPRTLGLALWNSVGVTGFNGLHTLFFNLPAELPLTSYSYRAMVGNAPEDHVPALAAIRASRRPFLVLVGSKDEAFQADRYGIALGPEKSALRIIPGASHDGVLVDPRTISAVARWLGSHPADTAHEPTT
ncbi:MAG TPA: alpha/beta hydrolase [Thermoanaerobaculia bacterium]|jgi:alpha-beta hydrolase superfamily lysophospholipase|nr:alpha/beta hydrolase [Thermoanaerobaculia bacterium]